MARPKVDTLAGALERTSWGDGGSAPPDTATGLATEARFGCGCMIVVSRPAGGLAAPDPYR